ncbi:MAG: hypothetical protein AAFR68_06180 [Pseudomonadota bacterium]
MTRDKRTVEQADKRRTADRCCDDQCCQELLMSAADGTLSIDHSLERALDHLERAQ